MGGMIPPVMVCGVVRNGGLDLAPSLNMLSQIKEITAKSEFVIVTNDNTDSTDEILEEWRQRDQRHVVLRRDGLARAFPIRIDRICAARNFYLSYLRQYAADTFTFLIVADLD